MKLSCSIIVIEVIICVTIPVPKGRRQRSLDHMELKHRMGHELLQSQNLAKIPPIKFHMFQFCIGMKIYCPVGKSFGLCQRLGTHGLLGEMAVKIKCCVANALKFCMHLLYFYILFIKVSKKIICESKWLKVFV